VTAAAISPLFAGQFLLDRRDQARIAGFNGGGEGGLFIIR
jgi:hypothetical protein